VIVLASYSHQLDQRIGDTNSKRNKIADSYNNKSSAFAEMGDRLATLDIGRKVGEGCCAPFRGQIGPHLTISPKLRPTSVPSSILIHPTVWPQYANVTYKTDRTTVLYSKRRTVTVAKTAINNAQLPPIRPNRK